MSEAIAPATARSWPMAYGWALVSLVAVAGVLVAPLATYVLMIAAFGLPHVLCELRYCDERFSGRLPRRTLVAIGLLLAGVAGARIAQAAGLLPSPWAIPIEFGLGALLALVAATFMARWRGLGVLVGVALVTGASLAPIATFLLWAWLHNITPLLFIAELTRGRRRRGLIGGLAVPFLLLPAVVATGLPHELVSALTGHVVVDAPSALGAGLNPRFSFLPPGAAWDTGVALFSAAVVAQAMHYFAVIVVLPRLLAEEAGGAGGSTIIPWPRWASFYGAIAGVAVLVFLAHAFDYATARKVYGVAAAIHTWVELPIFLLALSGALSATPGSRAPHHRMPH